MYLAASNVLSPVKKPRESPNLLKPIAKIPVTAGGAKNLLPNFHKPYTQEGIFHAGKYMIFHISYLNSRVRICNYMHVTIYINLQLSYFMGIATQIFYGSLHGSFQTPCSNILPLSSNGGNL